MIRVERLHYRSAAFASADPNGKPERISKPDGIVLGVRKIVRSTLKANRVLAQPTPQLGIVPTVQRERDVAVRPPLIGGVPDVRRISARRHRSPSPRIKRVPHEHGAHAVGHFSDTAQMITGEEAPNTCDLFTLLECAPRDRRAIGVAVLANLNATPEHTRVGLRDATLFLHHADPALQAVVREFGSMRADVDRDELVACVPLEGACAVRRQVPIRVIRERLASARLVHLIGRRALIAAPIRRRNDDRRRPIRRGY